MLYKKSYFFDEPTCSQYIDNTSTTTTTKTDNMDLANLSLGQIASMLSPKQQEVLLASISVAANFIQQLQQEEQEKEQLMNIKSESTLHDHQNHGGLDQSPSPSLEEDEEEDDDEDEEDEDDDGMIASGRDSTNIMTTSINSTNSKRHHQHQHLHHNHSNNNSINNLSRNNNSFNNSNHHHHQLNNSTTTTTTTNNDEQDTDLLTIRLFAEELKQRRKTIRLSQKGAAQSLRAFTGGVQPCTDAIIYHFENLQLEPERAMQLIPLLKEWLEWAENYRLNGKNLPMMSAVTKVPRERKRKVVLFNEKAKHYLEDAFAKNNHPDRYQLDVISEELNIPTRSIRKWFTNRRQRKRFAEKFEGNTSSGSIS